MTRKTWIVLMVVAVVAALIAACGTPTPTAAPKAAEPTKPPAAPTKAPEPTKPPAPTTAPTTAPTPAPRTYLFPEVEKGKFNVGFVFIGVTKDGGWTQAHDQGRLYLEQNVPNVKTAYVELVQEGADSELVMRSLARKGFDVIIATSFGYQFPMQTIASEFPNIKFIHVSGFLKNSTNYGNMFGAMEDMKYLAGMIAGARAKADGRPKIGYIAPWPIPEVIRLGNAIMLGAKQTCPECTMEVRWIFTWFDPDKERDAAKSLLDAGVDVVITGADTPGPLVAAGQANRWGITYDFDGSCQPDLAHCLTAPYWKWGVIYAKFIKEIQAGTWKPSDFYGDADTGMVGILGFDEGQTPAAGVPKDVIDKVKAKYAEMKAGKFTRFDIFKGPLKDNKGNTVVPAGQTMTQEDLEGLDEKTIKDNKLTGRTPCKICMNWLAEGIVGTIPPMPSQ